MTQLAQRFSIHYVVDEYNKKLASIPAAIEAANSAVAMFQNAASMEATYGGTLFRHSPDFCKRTAEKHLLSSSWRFVWKTIQRKYEERTGTKLVIPATHKKRIDEALENPDAFTVENLNNVFADYVLDPRGMMLKTFAEIFCSLDPYYKSHDNMRVGVKGLPKRVIVHCYEYSRGGWEKTADIINTLAAYRGFGEEARISNNYELGRGIESGEIESFQGLTFKFFKNRNLHIIFDKAALRDINLALAEYYGDVLPDEYQHTDKKQESTEVSKDLQFYRTPDDVADRMMREVYITDGYTVLEPSCGDGALLDALRRAYPNTSFSAAGVEVDASRAEICRAKGYSVVCANFLEASFKGGEFDVVVMNPPFYGRHYAKHIRKALSFLKEGGRLYSILPATARYNHGELDDLKPSWRDLPVGSFRESGTNINTVICEIKKR